MSWNSLIAYNSYTTSATGYNLNLLKDFTSLVSQSTLSTPGSSVSPSQTSFEASPTDPYLAYSSQSFFSKERLELLHNVTSNRSSKVAIQNNQTFLDPRLTLNFKPLSSQN